MLSQAIEKSGNTIPKEIIYKIVSDWSRRDKDELISSIRGPMTSQEEMDACHGKFMKEAKADRQKLQNMNKQQASYIKNLESMQKDLQSKIEDLKNQLASAKKHGRKSGGKHQPSW